jgi:hypothetical protein
LVSTSFVPGTFILDIHLQLSQSSGRGNSSQRPRLSPLPVFFEVASILVHWDVYDPAQNGEYPVGCFQPFFELDVFIPERMGKEVQTNTGGTSLEKPN